MSQTSAFAIATALGVHWHPRGVMARCPAHEDKTPSLAISVGKTGQVLVKCFSGCSQTAVIDALRAKGLWAGERDPGIARGSAEKLEHERQIAGDAEAKRKRARQLWDATIPIEGTLAEVYLTRRGLPPPYPNSLRFHPAVKHGVHWKFYPAMVAAIVASRGVAGVQRTYLTDKAWKIPTEAKRTLAPMDDGAVRLGVPFGTLGIAEGIETGLSASRMFALPVWCALSAVRLSKLWIPDDVRRLIIFADRGEVGQREATNARDIYQRRGLSVEIMTPEKPALDWNDALVA
jgi:hypothetical protein